MNFKKIIYPAILVICSLIFLVLGIYIGNISAYYVPQPGTLDFSLFWDSYSTLKENFIHTDRIKNDAVVYGAIKGMTEALEDPYTTFFDPEEAKMFQQDLTGSFDGIGVEIGIKNDLLTVVAPLEGTPGEKAGLEPGDAIVKINGQDTSGMSTEKAVTLIRGKKGTVVTLNIFREGWDITKDIEIVRDTITVPSIKLTIKDKNIAYIQIFQFSEALATDFPVIAKNIIDGPVEKIILDLRGNPGGYLDVAQWMAGWFLPAGKIVTIEDYGDSREQNILKTDGNSSLSNYPMVILINGGSASASEILAGTLRDNRGIKLIGEKSFGKGSVQNVVTMPGGSFLKITIANWLTPKGDSITEVGLTPDVKIDITEQDREQKKDSQLDKALEIIKNIK